MFFVSTNRINLLNLKERSERPVTIGKGFLKLPNLHMLIKQESIWLLDFWQIPDSVLNKGKSTIPPLFHSQEVLLSASDKTKLFAKNFCKNSNFDHSGIFLLIFPSRTNLKLHNIISVTPKMVTNVITNHDS